MQCVYGLIIWPWSFGGNAYCTTIKTSDNPFHMCGRIYICNNAQQPQPWYYGVKIIISISPPQITHTIVYWTVSFIAFGIQYVLHEEGKFGFWIFVGRVNIILNPIGIRQISVKYLPISDNRCINWLLRHCHKNCTLSLSVKYVILSVMKYIAGNVIGFYVMIVVPKEIISNATNFKGNVL